MAYRHRIAGGLLCLIVVATLLSLVAAGCSSALRRTRRLLSRDDIIGAAAAAGTDRYALQEVSLEVLARGLTTADSRASSSRGLRAAGELARPRLRQLVTESEDDIVEALAAEALAKLGDHRMVKRLGRQLEHEEPQVRAAALRAVGPTVDGPDFFATHLNDPDSRVRAAAVSVLADQREEWAAELLAQTAQRDPAPNVRAIALGALARLGTSEVLLETVRAELDRPDNAMTVRLAAIGALGHVEDIPAAEVLLLHVLGSDVAMEQLRAATVLASYGNERGHEHLRIALSNSSISTAGGAAVAASTIGGPLEDALIEALDRREPEVRLQVASSLLRLGEYPQAMTELGRLADQPGWIGLQAAITLARHNDSTSRAALRLAEALEDDDPELRAFAALSCGFLDLSWEIASAGLGDDLMTVRVAAATSVLRALNRD